MATCKHLMIRNGLAGALMSLASVNAVHAAQVFETSGTMSGNAHHEYSFEIGSIGSYTATLTDFGFPEDFQVLRMKIRDDHHSLGQITGPGQLSFSANNTGSYTAMVFGNTTPGNYRFGSYGLSISPVPEPETWALLLIGAGLMGFQLYRQRNQSALAI